MRWFVWHHSIPRSKERHLCELKKKSKTVTRYFNLAEHHGTVVSHVVFHKVIPNAFLWSTVCNSGEEHAANAGCYAADQGHNWMDSGHMQQSSAPTLSTMAHKFVDSPVGSCSSQPWRLNAVDQDDISWGCRILMCCCLLLGSPPLPEGDIGRVTAKWVSQTIKEFYFVKKPDLSSWLAMCHKYI